MWLWLCPIPELVERNYLDRSFYWAVKEGKPGKFELANGGTIFLDEIEAALGFASETTESPDSYTVTELEENTKRSWM